MVIKFINNLIIHSTDTNIYRYIPLMSPALKAISSPTNWAPVCTAPFTASTVALTALLRPDPPRPAETPPDPPDPSPRPTDTPDPPPLDPPRPTDAPLLALRALLTPPTTPFTKFPVVLSAPSFGHKIY